MEKFRGHHLVIAIAIGLAVAILACAATGPVGRGARSEREPQGKIGDLRFIDVHNHLLVHYGPLTSARVDCEGAAQVALAAMDRVGIARMFIMPPPFTPEHPNLYTYEELLGAVKNYPDRFFVTPRANTRTGPPRREGQGAERLLALLPPELAQKVGVENAVRIFKLPS